MDGDNDPGAGRDERFNLLRIDVGVPGHRVSKDNAGPFPDKCKC